MIHESISPLQKYPDEVTTCRLRPALLKENLCTYPLGESFAISPIQALAPLFIKI